MDESEARRPEEESPKEGGFWKELIKFILFVLLILIPLRLFVAQPFIVVGTSMEPTFSGGEYLIVDELSYHLGNPARGDVVIFHPPPAAFNDAGKGEGGVYYIKRVIGLPNETVIIKNDQVTIKNAATPLGFVLDQSYVKYQGEKDSTTVLGPKEYFVMGDNRPVSYDSRSWGPVSRDLIVGRAFLRLLPPDRLSVFPGSIK